MSVQNQWLQIQRDPRNLSASALYRLFLSGITLIYLVLKDPQIMAGQQTVLTDLEACQSSLSVFVGQFPWAMGYRDCFGQLKDRIQNHIRLTGGDVFADLNPGDIPFIDFDTSLLPNNFNIADFGFVLPESSATVNSDAVSSESRQLQPDTGLLYGEEDFDA